jgi:3-methyladenine DNA glycosylase AlkD
MKSAELIKDIKMYCREHASAGNVLKYSKYFKEPYVAHGLTQPQIREKVKTLLKDNEVSLPVIMNITPALFESGMYEEIMFSLLLLDGRAKFFSRETFDFLSGLFEIGVTNWAHADTIGMNVAPHFLKRNIIGIEELETWLVSNNRFQRRCVPVTLIKSLKTTTQYHRMFSAIEPLMTDPHREVHQGVGWFIREAWKRQPGQAERFLFTWKDRAPRLIIQYACEKMTAEGKAQFKKTHA